MNEQKNQKVFCKQCEGTDTIIKTGLTLGSPLEKVTVWLIYECKDCGYYTLVKQSKDGYLINHDNPD